MTIKRYVLPVLALVFLLAGLSLVGNATQEEAIVSNKGRGTS